MSSTTRVGFVVPAVSDFADETIYFDNNITTYEAELPIAMAGSLPGSGNYSGRVRALDTAAVTSPPQPEYPFDGYVYNGSAWVRCGSAGTRRNSLKTSPANGSSLPNTSGPEVFQSSVMPGFNLLSVTAGQVLKFCFSYEMNWFSSTNRNLLLNGALNVFIDPNSASQPTPTTPGVVRLSSPIVFSNDPYAGNGVSLFEAFYSEFFYLTTTSGNLGVAVYLSATNVTVGGGEFVGIYDPAGLGLVGVNLGIGATQFNVETCGTWSA